MLCRLQGYCGAVTASWVPPVRRLSESADRRNSRGRRPVAPTYLVVLTAVPLLLLALAGCSGSDDSTALSDQSNSASAAVTIPGIVNLDDADLLIDDLRVDPEIRAELSAELALQLDISAENADCLAAEIDVEDLLAMSASNADEGALERILEAFDSCDVPRSVFDQ